MVSIKAHRHENLKLKGGEACDQTFQQGVREVTLSMSVEAACDTV